MFMTLNDNFNVRTDNSLYNFIVYSSQIIIELVR